MVSLKMASILFVMDDLSIIRDSSSSSPYGIRRFSGIHYFCSIKSKFDTSTYILHALQRNEKSQIFLIFGQFGAVFIL